MLFWFKEIRKKGGRITSAFGGLYYLMLPFYYLQEIDGLMSLMAECFEDKDMLNTATEEMGQAVEEERRL